MKILLDTHIFLWFISGDRRLPEQSPEIYLPRQRKRHHISSLSVDEACVTHLSALPVHHRDPFDRMLICQALEHNLVLATVDGKIKKYLVNTLQ
ncbi:MAG: type II toxin-antitoxin system VapC family toxin [Candidatus Electrothrix gigas]